MRSLSAFLVVLALTACGDEGTGGPDAAPADPGALVRVSMDSTVGVLLDELPAPLRERAAAEILARPEASWRVAAERQISAMRLRLTYRRYYSLLEGLGLKAQLPLPPESQWTITFDPAGPQRTTIDGHDLVAVGFHFEGMMVTDVGSPGFSEPALGEIGGVWDEPFTLPVDPDQLTARTGNACVRPSDSFDPGDAEGALRYYDFTCKAMGDAPPLGCHSEPVAEDCIASLEAHVGSVTTGLRFERLPWDEATAAQWRQGMPTVDGADLEVLEEGLARHYVEYIFVRGDSCTLVEQSVGGAGWRRVLKFDATLKNVGSAAVHLGTVANSVLEDHNVFEYSPCHAHAHFRYYGDFEYATGAGFTGDKRAFCLLSTTRFANHEGVPMHSDYDNCNYQGISEGWGDDYFAGLDGQWIDVTDVPAGSAATVATLSFTANPAGFMCEGTPVLDDSDDFTFEATTYTTDDGAPIDRPVCSFVPGYLDNNLGVATVSLPPRGSLATEPCTRGQIGPWRDCGFAEQATSVCTGEAAITVVCDAPAASAPQLVRLCEYSERLGSGIACTGPHALAGGVWDGTPLQLELTCPAQRDAAEVGGKYSVFAGPAFDGDAAATVTCTVQ